MLSLVTCILFGAAPSCQGLDANFRIETLQCVDHGRNERYCPYMEYPPHNAGFVPTRAQIRVKDGRLVPATRRERDDAVGLRFEYDVSCTKRKFLSGCVAGHVTLHVRPSATWDKEVSWLRMLVELLAFAAVLVFLGPLVLVLACLFGGGAPTFKRDSFFSDD